MLEINIHAETHGAGGAGEQDSGQAGDAGVALAPRVRKPSQYAVVLHNDDYTTMEFVIEVLRIYFRRTEQEAVQIMLKIHHAGSGVAGIYPFEIAETKAMQVEQHARAKEFPLKCSVEPLSGGRENS